jgi:hypothetical protein
MSQISNKDEVKPVAAVMKGGSRTRTTILATKSATPVNSIRENRTGCTANDHVQGTPVTESVPYSSKALLMTPYQSLADIGGMSLEKRRPRFMLAIFAQLQPGGD